MLVSLAVAFVVPPLTRCGELQHCSLSGATRCTTIGQSALHRDNHDDSDMLTAFREAVSWQPQRGSDDILTSFCEAVHTETDEFAQSLAAKTQLAVRLRFDGRHRLITHAGNATTETVLADAERLYPGLNGKQLRLLYNGVPIKPGVPLLGMSKVMSRVTSNALEAQKRTTVDEHWLVRREVDMEVDIAARASVARFASRTSRASQQHKCRTARTKAPPTEAVVQHHEQAQQSSSSLEMEVEFLKTALGVAKKRAAAAEAEAVWLRRKIALMARELVLQVNASMGI